SGTTLHGASADDYTSPPVPRPGPTAVAPADSPARFGGGPAAWHPPGPPTRRRFRDCEAAPKHRSTMARIAIGGFQHETNTFAPTKAGYDAFARGGSWPALVSGDGMCDAVKGINLSIAGFIEAAQAAGHDLVPTTWAAASPSAEVTDDAFERITGLIVDGLRAALAAGPLDAVYLCLHGAM